MFSFITTQLAKCTRYLKEAINAQHYGSCTFYSQNAGGHAVTPTGNWRLGVRVVSVIIKKHVKRRK